MLMKKLLSLFIAILSCGMAYAQVESDFEKFKKQQEEEMKLMQKNDNDAMASLEKEYLSLFSFLFL